MAGPGWAENELTPVMAGGARAAPLGVCLPEPTRRRRTPPPPRRLSRSRGPRPFLLGGLLPAVVRDNPGLFVGEPDNQDNTAAPGAVWSTPRPGRPTRNPATERSLP